MPKKIKKLKQILDKISTTEEKFLDALENGEEIAKEDAIKIYKSIATPEEKVMDFLENIESINGKDGKTPTPEELQNIIKPLIPEPVPGKKIECPNEYIFPKKIGAYNGSKKWHSS